jgi:hypothetical protein
MRQQIGELALLMSGMSHLPAHLTIASARRARRANQNQYLDLRQLIKQLHQHIFFA